MLAKLLAFLIISCFGSCLAYKPVYIIHGIWANVSSVSTLVNTIKQHHPSTEVYTAAQCENKATLTRSMENQTLTIGEELIQISNSHPEGIHLIGYSQGGLVARGILEQFPTHRVQNFISLSSPQAGEYRNKLLHKAFPRVAEILKIIADRVFYGQGVLRGTSVAGYWNDPI